MMRIEKYNDNRKEWDSYVQKSEESSIFHQIGWKSVIEKTYGHKAYYLIAKDNGEVKGVLPLFLISNRLMGRFLVSLPFHCIGGVCADEDETAKLLINQAIKITKETGADYLEMRQYRKLNFSELDSKEHKSTYILQLDMNPEIVWKDKFSSNLRNKIRKGIRANITISSGNNNVFIKKFYNIFSRNMRDLGTPVMGIRLIENIVREFSDQTRIFIASHDQRDIGCKFVMFYKKTVYFIWASALRDYLRFAPSSLLNWEAIKYSCKNGMELCDFGRSSINDGAYHFKRQFGGEKKQLYWQYFLNKRRDIPNLNLKNEKFNMAINIWKRLPVFITNFVGPKIVKYIP